MINFDKLNEEVEKRGSIITLDNGLTLVLEDTPGSRLIAGEFVIDAGSCHEKPQEAGLMHFIEHACFSNGSRNYPDKSLRDRRASLLGLELNAITNYYKINFPVMVIGNSPLLKDNFFESMKIVSDLIFYPILNEESIKNVKPIVLRELFEKEQKLSADSYSKVNRKLSKIMFGAKAFSPLDGLGSEESIDSITLDRLIDKHSRFFVSNNTIFNLVGDIDSERDKIIDLLSNFPYGKKNKPKFIKGRKFNGSEIKNFKQPIKTDNVDVLIYYQIPNENSLKSYDFQLLIFALSGGWGSLLYEKLREEKKYVYSIGSKTFDHGRTGYLEISYTVKTDKLKESLDSVDECIKNIKAGEFSNDLVNSYKARILPKVILGLQGSGWVKDELFSRYCKEQLGFESTSLERIKRIFNLTKDDVVNAANEYLNDDKLIVIIS